MIFIKESTRENPASFTCNCGYKVSLVLHHDYLENSCQCGRHYAIKAIGETFGIVVMKPKIHNYEKLTVICTRH